MTNHSLLNALRIDKFNDRRKALRELATPALAGLNSHDVFEAFENSRLVGTEMAEGWPATVSIGPVGMVQ